MNFFWSFQPNDFSNRRILLKGLELYQGRPTQFLLRPIFLIFFYYYLSVIFNPKIDSIKRTEILRFVGPYRKLSRIYINLDH